VIESGVSEKRGFYLWGFYNKSHFWVNVYLGISKKGKEASNLRARILEELKDERAFLWRAYCSKDKVMSFDPRYQTQVKRALRKGGATHVFWIEELDLPPKSFESVENDLVEAMNPTGNRRRLRPSGKVEPKAGELLSRFREMIHLERDKKPASVLKLNYHKEFWESVGEAEPTAP